MSDVHNERDWEELQVTDADLERIAKRIRESNQAQDLTALARRIVKGRLLYGTEVSREATGLADSPVRLWDPAGEWQTGDHVIVVRLEAKAGHVPLVGEIEQVAHDDVRVRLDRIGGVTYKRARAGSQEAEKWREKVREVVAVKERTTGLEARLDAVLLRHGEHIISQLLGALRGDSRFVRLAGRWFLRELATIPTEQQLIGLAWDMLRLDSPTATDQLVALVEPRLVEGDRGLFGLYLAMRERPDLFTNADPQQRPRWVLAGPPPGSLTPQHAAYDPESYEILCLPREPIPPETVRRLWDLGLLAAVA